MGKSIDILQPFGILIKNFDPANFFSTLGRAFFPIFIWGMDNSNRFELHIFLTFLAANLAALLSSGINRWGHERSECTPAGIHPFVMHQKGWNLAVRTVLLAGAFLPALALTDSLAPCSAFTFTTASTIVRPFRPSWGAFAISPRHPNHLLSQILYFLAPFLKTLKSNWFYFFNLYILFTVYLLTLFEPVSKMFSSFTLSSIVISLATVFPLYPLLSLFFLIIQ